MGVLVPFPAVPSADAFYHWQVSLRVLRSCVTVDTLPRRSFTLSPNLSRILHMLYLI